MVMLFVTNTTVTKFFILLLFFVLGLKTRLKSSCNETKVLREILLCLRDYQCLLEPERSERLCTAA